MSWINVNEKLPESEELVLITLKYKKVYDCQDSGAFVSTAAHVGYHEFTTEDWRDYEGDTEYDEVNDCYWIKPCWYEVNIVDDNPNWQIPEYEFEITHWMSLPDAAKR